MLTRKEILPKKTAGLLRDFFPGKDPVLFDIETTGLGWRRSHLYLIGVLYLDGDDAVLAQLFLDRPADEKEMLQAFLSFAEERAAGGQKPLYVHFNGDIFDIPYIRHKCEFYGLADPFENAQSTDLYRRIRPFQKLLGLSSLRQKSVETYLHVAREDERDGGELISIYEKYLATRDEDLLQLLFLHNHDDVAGLAEILPALAVVELFDGQFEASPLGSAGEAEVFADTAQDFADSAVSSESGKLSESSGTNTMQGSLENVTQVEACKSDFVSAASNFAYRYNIFSRDYLTIDLQARHTLPDAFLRETLPIRTSEKYGAVLAYDTTAGLLILSLPIRQDTLKYFFDDYKNYYYLPLEDQAIHKDVAIYADKDKRVKATKKTCYQKKEGRFLPEPAGKPATLHKTLFYEDYKTEPAYFPAEELRAAGPEALRGYAARLLHVFLDESKGH